MSDLHTPYQVPKTVLQLRKLNDEHFDGKNKVLHSAALAIKGMWERVQRQREQVVALEGERNRLRAVESRHAALLRSRNEWLERAVKAEAELEDLRAEEIQP